MGAKRWRETVRRFCSLGIDGMPEGMYRCVTYDVPNGLLRLARDSDRDFIEEGVVLPDELFATRPDSVWQHFAAVTSFACEIAGALHRAKESRNGALAAEMISYLRSNAARLDFSVTRMAQHFGLCQSYAGRYFKDQVGSIITHFVQDLRMEEAKRLLVKGDQPIHEIVVSVAYFDVSSFMKRFRTEVRLTPGQYRKLHRAGSHGEQPNAAGKEHLTPITSR